MDEDIKKTEATEINEETLEQVDGGALPKSYNPSYWRNIIKRRTGGQAGEQTDEPKGGHTGGSTESW